MTRRSLFEIRCLALSKREGHHAKLSKRRTLSNKSSIATFRNVRSKSWLILILIFQKSDRSFQRFFSESMRRSFFGWEGVYTAKSSVKNRIASRKILKIVGKLWKLRMFSALLNFKLHLSYTSQTTPGSSPFIFCFASNFWWQIRRKTLLVSSLNILSSKTERLGKFHKYAYINFAKYLSS